jgi:Ras family protein T1
MTRVRLPPDPHHPVCITTIVDSQAGDVALQQQIQYYQQQQQPPPPQQQTTTSGDESSPTLTLLGTTAESSLIVDTVDSIVLVYDLDRTETFARLENHWLPLIEQCYEGKVRNYMIDTLAVIVGNHTLLLPLLIILLPLFVCRRYR